MSEDGTLRLWDAEGCSRTVYDTGTPTQPEPERLSSCCVDGTAVFIGRRDGSIDVLDLEADAAPARRKRSSSTRNGLPLSKTPAVSECRVSNSTNELTAA